jgi:hypothetical protein
MMFNEKVMLLRSRKSVACGVRESKSRVTKVDIRIKGSETNELKLDGI